MKKYSIFMSIVLLFVFLLGGCQSVSEVIEPVVDDPNIKTVEISALTYISRYVDGEAGIVCYVFIGYEKGGIDFLPIDETSLR